MASTTNPWDEQARRRLTKLPAAGRNKWADRYAVDVPHLLGRITELEAALTELHEFVETELDPEPLGWASYYTNPASATIAAALQARRDLEWAG
jgi:hypothetical protein